MAAHLVLLRLAQLADPFRAGWRRALVAAVALVLGVAAVVVAILGVLSLRDAAPTTAAVTSIALGAVLVVAFFAGPFVAGRQDPLEPRALVSLPLRPAVVAPILALCGTLTFPAFGVIALDIALAMVGAAHGAGVGAAVFGVILHVVTCVLAARLGFAAATRTLHAGRMREAVALTALAASVVIVPAGFYAFTQDWSGGAPPLAVAVADVLVLTPLGAAAGISAIVPATPGPVIVAILTVLVAAVAWYLRVRAALTTLPREREERRGSLGWFGVFPGNAAGAIGARGVFYWSSDLRYLANIAIVPLAGLLPIVPLMIAGTPAEIVAIVPLPIIAAFLGWILHNDLAYDSEAVWIHLVTGVRGFWDRLGRLVPITIVAVPMLAIAVALTAAVSDRWDALPAFIGVALALFLGGLGFSSITSAAAPYPVARPGDSPFRQPQRAGMRGAVAPSVALILTILAAVPTGILAGRTYFQGTTPADDALLWGAVTGGGLLIVGLLIGGVIFDLRGHRILEMATRTA